MLDSKQVGLAVCKGIALAEAMIYRKSSSTFDTSNVSNKELELQKLGDTIQMTDEYYRKNIQDLTEQGSVKNAEIIEIQRTMLGDKNFIDALYKEVNAGNTAVQAIRKVTDEQSKIFTASESTYIQERVEDVIDLALRMTCVLTGCEYCSLATLKKPVIVVADDIPPSILCSANTKFIKGIVLRNGGITSHTVLLASSLDIPIIIGYRDAMNLTGLIFLDGEKGTVENVTKENVKFYSSLVKKSEEENNFLLTYRDRETCTKNGMYISLKANVFCNKDVDLAVRNNAAGIGLYRTEFLFMDGNSLPSLEKQFSVYSYALRRFPGKTVRVRTIDVGGDKIVPALGLDHEQNSFLGYRAIRYCLDNHEVFTEQLKACVMASRYNDIDIMLPMISSCTEIRETRQILNQCIREVGLQDGGRIRLGIMVEVPAVAIMADKFAQECDFFSIGTNDLTQYTLAVDRHNSRVNHLYSWYSPAVLKLIKMTLDAANSEGIPCGICGSMASDTSILPIILGMGIKELSVSSVDILNVRLAISRIDTDNASKLAKQALRCKTKEDVMDLCKKEYNILNNNII